MELTGMKGLLGTEWIMSELNWVKMKWNGMRYNAVDRDVMIYIEMEWSEMMYWDGIRWN